MDRFQFPNFGEQIKMLDRLIQETPEAEAHWASAAGKLPKCDTDWSAYDGDAQILLTDFGGFVYLVTQTQIKFCQECAQTVSQILWNEKLSNMLRGGNAAGIHISNN